MDFYSVEYMLKELEEFNKEEEKRYNKEEKEQQKQVPQIKTPKMDSYGGFKTPKMNIPKPKF
jgi:glutaredoxin